MKKFLNTIKETFFSRDLYSTVKEQSAWSGVGFLMKLAVLIGVVVGIIAVLAGIVFIPRAKHAVNNFVAANYPQGLVVTIKDGTLTANTPDPIIIPASAVGNKSMSPELPHNLFVLAPSEAADITVLGKYDAFAVATSTAVIAASDSKDVRAYSYGKTNTVITKDSAFVFIEKAEKLVTIIGILAIIPLIILIVLGTIVANLVLLFGITFVLWVIYKIAKTPISYRRLYRQGVYALAPVLLLDCVAVPAGVSGKIFTSVIVILIILSVNQRSSTV